MIFVFGGAYQGKHDFAKEKFNIDEADIITVDNVSEESIDALIKENEKKVVIMNDISQGLVPIDAEERAYREASGRAMIRLAAAADEVYRVFCGIGVKIK